MTLPGTVYNSRDRRVDAQPPQLRRHHAASTPANAPNGPAPWGSSVGAFMVNGVLYTATNNGSLTKRTFNGSTYGTAIHGRHRGRAGLADRLAQHRRALR